jgi:hypothetical protein
MISQFVSEMVIKSTPLGLRRAEVPITLHKDGRSRRPWRESWRHLRFLLVYSLCWLFLTPASLLVAAGVMAYRENPRTLTPARLRWSPECKSSSPALL